MTGERAAQPHDSGSRPTKGRTLLILIGGHLATAPRPQKEALALRQAGAVVIVRGTWWSESLASEDLALARELDIDFAPVVDLRPGRGRIIRIRQRLAREAFRRFNIESPRLLGVGAPELLREAFRISADLTMVHSEAGLWVGKQLLDEGMRVGVDFEDWFSNNFRPSELGACPLQSLKDLERHLLRHASPCFATTQAMAEALAADAGLSRPPMVVPNCFPASARAEAAQGPRDPRPDGVVSFHWFSQTIGPGRGLETLAQALTRLKGPWHLTLRGTLHTHQAWYERTFPACVQKNIQLLGQVPNRELLARTMSHDVGLALEEYESINKDLTASNKIFEYLRAGLAVIATETRGQREVMAECTEAGLLIPPGDPELLTNAMQRMINEPELLLNARNRAAEAAQGTWAWETHSRDLAFSISAALKEASTRNGFNPSPGQVEVQENP